MTHIKERVENFMNAHAIKYISCAAMLNICFDVILSYLL